VTCAISVRINFFCTKLVWQPPPPPNKVTLTPLFNILTSLQLPYNAHPHAVKVHFALYIIASNVSWSAVGSCGLSTTQPPDLLWCPWPCPVVAGRPAAEEAMVGASVAGAGSARRASAARPTASSRETHSSWLGIFWIKLIISEGSKVKLIEGTTKLANYR
jgi:hypothetical protein